MEGFTNVYDVPRTVAKSKEPSCIGCQPSNQPTTRTRLQFDDDPNSDPGRLAVDASSQSTERHRNSGRHGSETPNREARFDVGTQQPPPQVATSQTTDASGTDGMAIDGDDDLQTQQAPHYDYYDQDEFDKNNNNNNGGAEHVPVTVATTAKATRLNFSFELF